MTAPTEEKPDYQFHGLQPVLPVADLAETVAFYRDKFGFEVDFMWGDPPSHARVSCGDPATGGPVYIQFTAGLRERPKRATGGWITIHLGRAIDQFYDALRDAGIVVLSKLEDKPWGLREFEIEDVNGHVLRFAMPIDQSR